MDLQMLAAVTDGGAATLLAEMTRLLAAAGFSAPVVHPTALASSVLVARAV
jgi:hypothetical protein